MFNIICIIYKNIFYYIYPPNIFLLSNLIYAYHYLFVCFKANLACISPSSLISLASDQRPLPGPLSSTAVPPPGRHDCLTGTLRTPYGGPSPPPRCWRTGVGYLCHSVWLQPLGDPYAIYIVTGYLHNAGGEGEKAIREIAWSNQTFPVDNDGRCMTGNVVEVTVNDSELLQCRWPGCVTLHLLIDTRVSVLVTDVPRV